MDGFRDRYSSRDRKMADRGGRDRYDRQDHYDRPDRYDRGSDRYERPASRNEYREENNIDIENVIEQSNAKQLEVFADCIDDVKNEVYASEQSILKAIDDVNASVRSGARSAAPVSTPMATQVQTDPAMKEEILQAIFQNKSLLDAVYEAVQKKEEVLGAEASAAETAEVSTEATNQGTTESTTASESEFRELVAKSFSNMEDHVHKENVKCYRNVQAAIAEQSLQDIAALKGQFGFLKVFTIITTVLGLVNIALWVLYYLGII